MPGEVTRPTVRRRRGRLGQPSLPTTTRTPGQVIVPDTSRTTSLRLGVIAHPTDVDDHDGVVADDPGIVSGRKRGDIAGPEFVFRSIIHHDNQAARHVVLQMGGLTALGVDQWFYAGGPFPARLQRRPAK